MSKEEFLNMIRQCYHRAVLNKREAAMELGGISTSTVDRMRREKKICSKKVSGKIMFKAEEVYRCLYEE